MLAASCHIGANDGLSMMSEYCIFEVSAHCSLITIN